MEWVIETERLGLRKMTKEDVNVIAPILQNEEVMYAWEHGFSNEEIKKWIDNNLVRYQRDGYSYFIAIAKEQNQVIGLMGPLVEEVEGRKQIGIAYILDKIFWGKGYAREGAQACMEYAFATLKADEVIAEIRHSNHSSRKVAEHLGMKVVGEFDKHYRGIDMPHLIYSKSSFVKSEKVDQ